MSKDFINYYYKNKKNFNIVKENKKKDNYMLKEGIFKFNVNLKKLTCGLCKTKNLCHLKKCHHIYQLYNTIYQIPINSLEFLWKNDNYINVLKGKEIVINEKDTECVICLDDVFETGNYDKITTCLSCGKYYHTKCLRRCKKFICLNCKKDLINNFSF